MKKIKVLFITLVFLLTINSINVCIIAAEEQNSEAKQPEKVLTEEEIIKQKQEILTSINAYLEEISSKLNIIDAKIENTKKQEEFDYYPAIRLNIDTPMFGMTSLVENKLRIRNDVSTADVASNYSIRDIVKNRSIKLPNSYLASIVMGTEEIKIDENMTLPQLKLTLVKCIQYESQVNSVDEFIDNQINKTFKDYIAQEKKDNIKDIKERNVKIKHNLEEISDKIYEMYFMGVDISEYMKLYNNASETLYNISTKAKDTLMNKTELTELVKSSLSNEAEVLDIKTKVEEAYENAILSLNYGATLEKFSSVYNSKYIRMNNFIKNSTTEEKKVVNEVEQTNIIQNYNVTSQSTLDYIDGVKKDIDKNLEIYRNPTASKVEEPKEKTKQELFNENKEKVDSLYNKYKEVLDKEYRFYTNNINAILKDSNTKMTAIIGQINSGIVISNDIFAYTKYIYIDLPRNLTTYLDKNNLDSTLEQNYLIDCLNNEINSLVKVNMNIKLMYNKMLEDSQKS